MMRGINGKAISHNGNFPKSLDIGAKKFADKKNYIRSV